MSKELETSKRMVELILKNDGLPTADGIYDLFEIKKGNKKVLLNHLKAIHSIMGDAIKELEGKKNENNKCKSNEE